MIISFSKTTPALLAGAKSCTRRDWSERTAEYFTSRLTYGVTGVWTDAYDRSPRNGGKKVAQLIVESVKREPLSEMPDSDYEAEGFAWLAEHGVELGDVWGVVPARQYPSLSKLAGAPSREYFELAKCSQAALWVVRFRVVD